MSVIIHWGMGKPVYVPLARGRGELGGEVCMLASVLLDPVYDDKCTCQ